MAYSLILALPVLVCLWLGMRAIREHRLALAARRSMLDEAGQILHDMRHAATPDHFPSVAGTTGDGTPARIELCVDTLVARRLPQLWLRVTLYESERRDVPSIGALSRPTGSEFYSGVHDLPLWLAPADIGVPLLMRGSERADDPRFGDLRQSIASPLSDPAVKEVLVTPTATRIMIQAAEGDRRAHMLLRQAQFGIRAVPLENISQALATAQNLRARVAGYAEFTRPEAA
jgi:hypothetical protein